ncbi:MAG: hypothetical protein HQ552_13135 [Desulfobacteraceae bacterium]|nr:hypothetical protein [Desulfobacteraceae bacterium]
MGKKLLVGFIVVVLLMVVLAVYLTDVSQHSLQKAVGTNSILLAGEMLDRINYAVYDKIEELQSHLKDESLQNIIRHSNREFENLDSLQEYVNQKDREWVQTPKDQIAPFMQVLIHNDLSNRLRRELVEFYNNKLKFRTPEMVQNRLKHRLERLNSAENLH